MNSKKNAFTLIELLAIIVILAIIAVITVPIILNIIENSRKGAATDSAYGFKDAVNKYYVTELSKPENQNFKLQDEYTVSNGVLNGTGISNVEIPLSGTKPSSGKLHYTNNVLDDGCLVVGDYKITFKSDGSVDKTEKGNCDDYEFPSEQGGTQQTATPLEIGDTVAYSTVLNNVTLDNWKVFYNDGNYTYLIYGDYLPNEAVKDDFTIWEYEAYTVKLDGEREDSINALMDTLYWSDLISNGKIDGINLDTSVSEDENVWAIGTPTVELWVNSWNTKYSSNTLYVTYSNDINDNGFDGWYISDSTNPDTNESFSTYLGDLAGYNNALYFPYNTDVDDCDGYWLASPSAYGENYRMIVNSYGTIEEEEDYEYALRPVIKLPTSVINQ